MFINQKVNDDAHIVALKLMHGGRTNKSVRGVRLNIRTSLTSEVRTHAMCVELHVASMCDALQVLGLLTDDSKRLREGGVSHGPENH